MIKLDMHTSCCGSLLKPLADIWDGSLLDSFEFFFTSPLSKSSPSWDGWNTGGEESDGEAFDLSAMEGQLKPKTSSHTRLTDK